MSTSSTPRHLSLPQRIVSKAFQKLWRLTRGHLLHAKALIWDENARLLVSAAGALPGTQVNRGEAAEMAIRRELFSGYGLVDPAVRLLAVMHVRSEDARATSTHVAVYDVTWDAGRSHPDAHAFAELAALEGVLAPDILTLARRCARERLARPM